MSHKTTLATEFFLLFILLPVSFAVEYPAAIKAILALAGFAYIVVKIRKEGITFGIKKGIDWPAFWKRTAITFLIIAAITTAFVWYSDKSALFYVPLNNPGLYLIILLIYTFLSVWPQEIIYRTFFFRRYGTLFRSESLLIFMNAVIFSLAHILFKNTLVLILTFIGGVIFGISYLKFRSTTLVSIEHALYGNWLFTVGMGEMLAFPGMEN